MLGCDMNLIKEKLSRIKLIHEDIRIYLKTLKVMGLDHIHFGYWKDDTDTIEKAQDNLYRLVKSYIPADVINILDIGGGIGGISSLLMQDGFNTLCVIPDRKLIIEGKKRFPDVKFLRGTAEYFTAKMRYDLALLIESYQYFTRRSKGLSNIVRHLNNRGWIIILDEFSLLPGGLPEENELIENLNRLHYYSKTRCDITKYILPTCEYVAKIFDGVVDTISDQWKKVLRNYLSGKRTYLMLIFQNKGD